MIGKSCGTDQEAVAPRAKRAGDEGVRKWSSWYCASCDAQDKVALLSFWMQNNGRKHQLDLERVSLCGSVLGRRGKACKKEVHN
jgi:hypothetical protein